MSLRLLTTLAAALVAALSSLGPTALDLIAADIRPADFAGHALDADRQSRGLAIAVRGVEAQGGTDAWQRQSALHIEVADDWDLTPFRWYMPLAEDRVTLQGDIELHRSLADSTWTITSGSAEGERFGVRDGHAWYGTEDHAAGPGTGFFAPTMEYLPTLAFHVPDAPVVSWIDTVQRKGKRYDRVFVTWGDPEQPTASVDQYITYYEQDTGRLALVECTVRDFGPLITGSVHYDGWDEGHALSLPTSYVMHLIDLDGPRVHSVRIDSVAWR